MNKFSYIAVLAVLLGLICPFFAAAEENACTDAGHTCRRGRRCVDFELAVNDLNSACGTKQKCCKSTRSNGSPARQQPARRPSLKKTPSLPNISRKQSLQGTNSFARQSSLKSNPSLPRQNSNPSLPRQASLKDEEQVNQAPPGRTGSRWDIANGLKSRVKWRPSIPKTWPFRKNQQRNINSRRRQY